MYPGGTDCASGKCTPPVVAGKLDLAQSRSMGKRPNRIKEWRDLRGMSQEVLAEKCATTHATISRLERGKLPLSEHWLRTIGKVLRVPMADLLVAEEQEALENAADLARDIMYKIGRASGRERVWQYV